jgi:hypothetical protein
MGENTGSIAWKKIFGPKIKMFLELGRSSDVVG